MTDKEKYELNKQNWTWVRNLTREEKEEMGLGQSIRGIYRCNVCDKEKFIVNSNFKRRLTVCDNGCHGVGQDTNQFIIGVNDLATTHPHLETYFVNKEEMTSLKASSNRHIALKCPHCGYIKEMLVYNFTNRGFVCPCCSDGFPTSEKFVANVLYNLGIEFKKEFRIDDNKRYDFYIPSLNAIIETHGIQHYTGSFRHLSGCDLSYEQENDREKKEKALASGIEHYIELDCRKSYFSFLQESIHKSPLRDLLELDKVNWEEVKQRMTSSLMLEVIEYFNVKPNVTVVEIASHFQIGKTSVARYLKKGTELGLCDYQRDGGAKKRFYESNTNKVIMVRNGVIENVFLGVNNTSKSLGFSSNSRICELCKGDSKYGHFSVSSKLGGLVGFYYLDSEDWERDKHLYADDKSLLKDHIAE